MKAILWWLIAGSKGGINRARLIRELHDRPSNANQLTSRLGLDYKTVRFHLKILQENGIIESIGDGRYGAVYMLSRQMEEAYPLFIDIWNKVEKHP